MIAVHAPGIGGRGRNEGDIVQEGGRHAAISHALNHRNAAGSRPETRGLVSRFVPDRASFSSSAVPTTDARAPSLLARMKMMRSFGKLVLTLGSLALLASPAWAQGRGGFGGGAAGFLMAPNVQK